MKKTQSAIPASTRPGPWRTIAVVSLLANAGLLAWMLALVARPARPAAVPPVGAAVVPTPPAALNVKSAYAALGSYVAENNRIADLGWTETQFAEFQAGLRASYEGRGLPLDEDAAKLRDEISARVQSLMAGEQPDPVDEYFRLLREREGAQRTASGLHYRVTEAGTGETPTAADTVVLSFGVRQPDGRDLPELSRTRVKIKVSDLLPGLAEGVQLLRVGGKGLMFLPPALSYRDADWPAQIPRGMPLGFFVELHEVVAAEVDPWK